MKWSFRTSLKWGHSACLVPSCLAALSWNQRCFRRCIERALFCSKPGCFFVHPPAPIRSSQGHSFHSLKNETLSWASPSWCRCSDGTKEKSLFPSFLWGLCLFLIEPLLGANGCCEQQRISALGKKIDSQCDRKFELGNRQTRFESHLNLAAT